VLAAVAVTAGCGSGARPAAVEAPANTQTVQRGALSSMVSIDGTLTYRARRDGSPYIAINQARGVYTKLPVEGDKVACGDVLYRVDDDPVLLLCGTVPAYRDLHTGDRGKDVRELNRTLGVKGSVFTARTRQKLKRAALDLGSAVVLPRAARISKVTAKLGAAARPGTPVVEATSDTLEVRLNLEPTQRDQVKPGDRARITLPDNTVVEGRVDRVERVARVDDAGNATIPAAVSLDARKPALDRAPVQVEIATKGVDGVLSVPVTALVGRSGGGFAVEVVRDGDRRELVAVRLGLFDTANGRVEVEGDLDVGDQVVVPTL
jgi:hypothetical protein